MHPAKIKNAYIPLALLVPTAVVFIWSAIHPHDWLTWWLEVSPGLIAIGLLMATYRRFSFTTLVYVLIALHCIVLFIGGHYTYALVPLFNDMKEWWGLSRNHYDRLGHVMQGLVPVMVARELLLRLTPLRRGKWLVAILLLCCLGISAAYELLEWAVAEASGTGATEFLATQGDIWDTQKDMALALAGAFFALLVLSPWHDKMLRDLPA